MPEFELFDVGHVAALNGSQLDVTAQGAPDGLGNADVNSGVDLGALRERPFERRLFGGFAPYGGTTTRHQQAKACRDNRARKS